MRREGERFWFNRTIVPQEELVQMKTISNSLAVFCLATYGEGDPTDNAMEFVEWLKNGDADLNGLNYAVSAARQITLSPSMIRFLGEEF